MARERIARKREENELEFGRIVAFSDGVFSIAITLLVLGLTIDRVPTDELAHALWEEREALLAYAISFAVIARFWLVHHSFFSEVKAFDSRLIGLNMLYLGLLVLIPFSSQVLGEYGGPAAVGGRLLGQPHRGRHGRPVDGLGRAPLRAATSDAQTERESLLRSVFIVGVFLLSIVVALFDASIAPYMWLALFFEGRGHVIERLSRPRFLSSQALAIKATSPPGRAQLTEAPCVDPHRLTAEAAERAGAARGAPAERAGVAALPARIVARAVPQSTAVARSWVSTRPSLQATTFEPAGAFGAVAFLARRRRPALVAPLGAVELDPPPHPATSRARRGSRGR